MSDRRIVWETEGQREREKEIGRKTERERNSEILSLSLYPPHTHTYIYGVYTHIYIYTPYLLSFSIPKDKVLQYLRSISLWQIPVKHMLLCGRAYMLGIGVSPVILVCDTFPTYIWITHEAILCQSQVRLRRIAAIYVPWYWFCIHYGVYNEHDFHLPKCSLNTR